MKTKNWSNVIIALTVIACSLVLLGALTIALGGYHGRPGGRALHVEFRDATGIKLHSPVRYAGAVAGTVTQIRYLTPEERKQARVRETAVRVSVQLNHEVPPLPSDVTAGLASETILGEKFIALSAGSPNLPALANGAIIPGKDVVSFDGLAGSAQETIENVNHILTRLNADYPRLVPRLADLLGQGNSLLFQGSNLIHNANGAVTNAGGLVAKFRTDSAEVITKLNALLVQGQGIATNVDQTIQQISTFVVRADALVQTNEPGLRQIIGELRVVSQNLKVISTYTKALTGTLGAKPSRLIWGGKKNPLPTEQQILESSQPIPIELPDK